MPYAPPQQQSPMARRIRMPAIPIPRKRFSHRSSQLSQVIPRLLDKDMGDKLTVKEILGCYRMDTKDVDGKHFVKRLLQKG